VDRSQDVLECSIFKSTLGTDDQWEDSLAYTADDGTVSLHPSMPAGAENAHPVDVVVRWDVTDSLGEAAEVEYFEDDFEDEDADCDEDEENSALGHSAKINSEGLLCDVQVMNWAVRDAGSNGESQVEFSESQLQPVDTAPQCASDGLLGEASPPMKNTAAQQRAVLEKKCRNLTSQITREYSNIVKDLDQPARHVWDELYSLFKAKISADLTDEDQCEIERHIFENLPTENVLLIWKVYKVLHLEQERDRCEKTLAERLDMG
jgi:hypothetical protein